MNGDFLNSCLIGACSDGASTMLGKHSGVLTRIQNVYPNILLWHCMCHRVELAVGDSVAAVSSVNHVKSFLDKLYSLYSQSPQMVRELEEVACDLECQLNRIGRVLDVRWAASSHRTLQAIWKNYPALHKHFEQCSVDPSKKSNHSMFKGLLNTLSSASFVHSLAILLDALSEVAMFSQYLQKDDATLASSYGVLRQTIRALRNQKEGLAGDASIELGDGKTFRGVEIKADSKPQLNKSQFLQALMDNLSSRLECTVASNRSATADSQHRDELIQLLDEIDMLNSDKWPSYVESPWPAGEEKLRKLCSRLNKAYLPVQKAFRNFIDDSSTVPAEIKDLQSCILAYPVSSSDCERGFSTMNLICTKQRNRLLVANISDLLFVSLVGPPVHEFNPEPYVKEWLKEHRDATDNRSRKTQYKHSDRYRPIWHLL
jgi:hypothetical protein